MQCYGVGDGAVIYPTRSVVSSKYLNLAVEAFHPHSRSEEVMGISRVCHVCAPKLKRPHPQRERVGPQSVRQTGNTSWPSRSCR